MAAITGTVVDAGGNGNVRVNTSDGVVDVGSDINTTVSINGAFTKAGPAVTLNSRDLQPGDSVVIGVNSSQRGLAATIVATR
jgi:hypothetical protein